MKQWLIGGIIAAILVIAGISFAFDFFLVKKVEIETPRYENIPVTVAKNPTLKREEVQAFLDEMSQWIRSDEPTNAADCFDLPGLYNIAKQIDLSPDPVLPNLIGDQLSRLYPALLEAAIRGGFGLPWDRIEFDQFLETKYGEPVIAVRQIAGDQVVPAWWWIQKTRKGFVVLDIEDRLLGLRVSQQFAILLGTGLDQSRAENLATVARAIRDATIAIRRDRPKQADTLLDLIRSTPMPAAQKSVLQKLDGLNAAVKGDTARVDALAAEWGDQPLVDLMLAMAAGGHGWQERRQNAAGKLEQLYGPTPLTISITIQSLLRRDKPDEARQCLDEGLKRFPDSPTLWAWSAALE
ncbi:MAG: hypothetical protein U0798_16165 [Gemmataceae bacterium]